MKDWTGFQAARNKAMDSFPDFWPEGRVIGVEEFKKELLEGSWECGEDERRKSKGNEESNKSRCSIVIQAK